MAQVYRNAIYLAIRADRTGYWQKSIQGAGRDLERLAEGFLCLIVFVPLPFVEFVGALADHLGTHRHAWAAVLARPIFGDFEQSRAGTEAPLVFGDDEPVQFRTSANLQKMSDTDVRPTHHSCSRRFRDEQGVL